MKKNIRKVKKFQKPLICLIGILIFVLGMTVEKIMKANADEINYEYESNSIDYDNSTSNLNATNVKEAIDELYGKVGQCPTGQFCSTSEELVSKIGGSGNFVSAYTYDENSCITGNESGCVKTNCYASGTCTVGTIIDYFVNNATIVRFHVLHDDGATITMQAQQNQVKGVAWHAGPNNTSYGPDTILAQLEIQTNSWTNVNDIQYNGNSTIFVGIADLYNIPSAMKNNYNFCPSQNSCDSNNYEYPTRTVKARMIMLQEARNVGCTTSNGTCPKFMFNYLNGAKAYGAPQEDNSPGNTGYWTMNSSSSNIVYDIYRENRLNSSGASHNERGARAVVVVNK